MNHPASTGEGDLLALPVREFLELLASSAPAPGGGAAAALAAALGAALVEMTANLTVGRPRLAAVEEQARRLRDAAAALRARLAADVAADAAAYARVSRAYRLPRASADERLARQVAIQSALQEAARVPLEVAQECRALVSLCEEAAPVLNPTVVSDVMVGALLARAGLEGAAVNVEVNLAALTDAAAAAALADALSAARSSLDEQVERVLAEGRARTPGG